MKTYRGRRLPINGHIDTSCDTVVDVRRPAGSQFEIYPLPWRLDLFNHSPTGLNWGYSGSGPAQLALALLADALGDADRAIRLHQAFKRKVVASLADNWQLDEETIRTHVAVLEEARPPYRV